MDKIPVVAVVGPTASGKTALAVALAKACGGEVISADSMQIYRGMDIATAKPTPAEMQGVPHHLIGFLPPERAYSVADFCADALKAAEDIVSRGKRVILAGGTGLYVDSLLSGMAFENAPGSGEARRMLLARREKEGIAPLYEELRAVDPDLAASIHVNNEKRVLRALEIWYATGEKPSAVRLRALGGESRFRSVKVGLFFEDRAVLYNRIDRRVDDMLQRGLVEEARRFYAAAPSLTAAQAIGYKELRPYLEGAVSLEEAAENLKRATRRYAKRQITWFSRSENVRRIYRDAVPEEALPALAEKIVEEERIFERS